ncbi:DUF3265 domain-containing protein [Vibrio alginolyticus]|nr:DUF3265 domain-containing protein [Vibrio alginolyticus]
MAFLLCVGFSVLGGMRRLRYCVAHPLTGRYNPDQIFSVSHSKWDRDTVYIINLVAY